MAIFHSKLLVHQAGYPAPRPSKGFHGPDRMFPGTESWSLDWDTLKAPRQRRGAFFVDPWAGKIQNEIRLGGTIKFPTNFIEG